MEVNATSNTACCAGLEMFVLHLEMYWHAVQGTGVVSSKDTSLDFLTLFLYSQEEKFCIFVN